MEEEGKMQRQRLHRSSGIPHLRAGSKRQIILVITHLTIIFTSEPSTIQIFGTMQ